MNISTHITLSLLFPSFYHIVAFGYNQKITPQAVGELDPKRLKEVINSGGRFEGEDIFFAPYTFTEFLDDYDIFEYNIVKGENRKVYLKPDRNSYVLGILSNEVIKINNETEEKIPETWSLVTLYNGKKGYILSRYLKSPIDFRVGFIKKKGVWKMNCFVEGD